jgi:hypothetical protein
MKKQFINIQGQRYRLSSIKRYHPTIHQDNNSNKTKTFGLTIRMSIQPDATRYIHEFDLKLERDYNLAELDKLFGIL